MIGHVDERHVEFEAQATTGPKGGGRQQPILLEAIREEHLLKHFKTLRVFSG